MTGQTEDGSNKFEYDGPMTGQTEDTVPEKVLCVCAPVRSARKPLRH